MTTHFSTTHLVVLSPSPSHLSPSSTIYRNDWYWDKSLPCCITSQYETKWAKMPPEQIIVAYSSPSLLLLVSSPSTPHDASSVIISTTSLHLDQISSQLFLNIRIKPCCKRKNFINQKKLIAQAKTQQPSLRRAVLPSTISYSLHTT